MRPAALGITVIVVLFLCGSAHAFSKPVREVAQEFLSKFIKLKCNDIAGNGSKILVSEAEVFLSKHGDEGLRMLEKCGAEIVTLTARHGDEVVHLLGDVGGNALPFVMKHVDEVLSVWRDYGKVGVDLVLAHPGLGTRLLQVAGRTAVSLSRRFTPASLQKTTILVAKVEDQAERGLLLEKLLIHGDKLLEFLWKHKAKLATTGGVYYLFNRFEEETLVTKEDGSQEVITERVSMADRVLYGLGAWLLQKVNWLLLPVAAIGMLIVYRRYGE